jgi:hypothetical protein
MELARRALSSPRVNQLTREAIQRVTVLGREMGEAVERDAAHARACYEAPHSDSGVEPEPACLHSEVTGEAACADPAASIVAARAYEETIRVGRSTTRELSLDARERLPALYDRNPEARVRLEALMRSFEQRQRLSEAFSRGRRAPSTDAGD